MSEKGMTLRGAITFAILASSMDVMDMDPGYVMEKVRSCELSGVPETILDSDRRAKFYEYAKHWKGYGPVDWDTKRDLHAPMVEVARRNRGKKP